MRITLITILLTSMLWLSGCGSELTAGGTGVVGGMGFQKTLEGMQTDLERREQSLIDHYNELVAAGARADDLEGLKQEIADTVRARQQIEWKLSFIKIKRLVRQRRAELAQQHE